MTIKWHIFATIILIQLKSFHCNTIELSSYSRVAKNGGNTDANAHTDQPSEVHRAREDVINSDLWQPKSGPSDNDADKSTGRAIDDSRDFPFPLKGNLFPTYDKASNHRYETKPNVVYPSLPASQIAQDRFVPRESLSYFTQKNANRVRSPINTPKESDREDDSPKNLPPKEGDSGGDSGVKYTPPKNLYSFPPNIGASYSPPYPGLPSPISVSSYLPPASGPTNYPIFPGPPPLPPLPPLPPKSEDDKSDDDKPDDAMPMDSADNSNSDGPPPPPPQTPGPVQFKFNKDPSDLMLDPAYLDQDAPQFDPHDHSHDHSHDHFPDHDHHQHHHHHDHHDHHGHHPIIYDSPFDDSLKHLHGYDAPEVIFDHPHHHDHDYFHDHHPIALPPPPPPTNPPPPPPPPEDIPDEPEDQPRVKKYSYFYLARSLWYIPLYFTVWFTFYVTWLILQSIGRHQAALPNHTVNRRSIVDLSHRETVDKVNVLTEFVMSQIDEFKQKHL